jgi:hypothetical protein
MVQPKWEFGTVYDDVIFMSSIYLLLLALTCIIPCAFRCVLQQKIETPTLVEIVSINPHYSVDDHFSFILCRY